MTVVLSRIAPPPFLEPVIPPLALYALAATLRDAGCGVRVVDPFGPGCITEIMAECERGASVVGMGIDSFNWGVTIPVLQQIKARFPDVLTVIGGVHATHFPDSVAAKDFVDVVVTGDGEQPLLDIAAHLADGGRPGDLASVIKATGELPTIRDDRPVPAYDLVPHGVYSVLPFMSSRGCPGRCVFCSVPRHRYQTLSPEVVCERLEEALRLAGDRFTRDIIYFTDDCFTGHPRRAVSLCKELAAQGWGRRLGLEARVADLMQPGVMDALTACDPVFVQIGVESGYDEGLNLVGKDVTIDQVRRCAAEVYDAGWSEGAMYTFIVGLPWEKLDDCLRTVHFAASLAGEYGGRASIAWFGLMPSPLWDRRREFGIGVDETMFEMEWGGNHELFSDIHPQLTWNDVTRVQSVIEAYESSGITMRQSLPWGRSGR